MSEKNKINNNKYTTEFWITTTEAMYTILTYFNYKQTIKYRRINKMVNNICKNHGINKYGTTLIKYPGTKYINRYILTNNINKVLNLHKIKIVIPRDYSHNWDYYSSIILNFIPKHLSYVKDLAIMNEWDAAQGRWMIMGDFLDSELKKKQTHLKTLTIKTYIDSYDWIFNKTLPYKIKIIEWIITHESLIMINANNINQLKITFSMNQPLRNITINDMQYYFTIFKAQHISLRIEFIINCTNIEIFFFILQHFLKTNSTKITIYSNYLNYNGFKYWHMKHKWYDIFMNCNTLVTGIETYQIILLQIQNNYKYKYNIQNIQSNLQRIIINPTVINRNPMIISTFIIKAICENIIKYEWIKNNNITIYIQYGITQGISYQQCFDIIQQYNLFTINNTNNDNKIVIKIYWQQ